MSGAKAPETEWTDEGKDSSIQSIKEIADDIASLESKIAEHVNLAVREYSIKQHGHMAGNVTVSDLAAFLSSLGVKSKLARELANVAVRRHEQFRWSDTGKQIQAEAAVAKGKVADEE
ncbi:hypothetical protein J3_0034 [Vibrio phage J3]|uniref:Uncharacterized protein n=1 Tax=Vibrio phage J2 TaxID=1558467 RepID=A0A0A7HDZ4_9CAUD|nr:hypothetical protein ACQ42_gp34 [Vibrio phage J2]AIZ01481.1 hypothetical protein H1_0034 [Vibrio phage H1]AIZ01529.1 hypothetical protein H2_0034 [Vibrio phage H2 SGB-2014]AIZ01577.1 hypothetical protein H3_0034 [Vibrio phage H3]AIZ01673.1 hypothetical protein J3_0034 [Vibrio phage J3]AIZ01625.1 hypothetical protein J2_0034 [Vibrio phage J2]